MYILVYIYIYQYKCMYIYIHIYIYMHTYMTKCGIEPTKSNYIYCAKIDLCLSKSVYRQMSIDHWGRWL